MLNRNSVAPKKTNSIFSFKSVFAALFLVVSIFLANLQLSSQRERSEIRNNGQKTTAVVVSRKEVEFNTYQGKVKAKPIVAPLRGTLKLFDAIYVYYDKENPSRVVLDQNDTGFNVTMWIVVIKLFGASLILGYFAFLKKPKKKLVDEKVN